MMTPTFNQLRVLARLKGQLWAIRNDVVEYFAAGMTTEEIVNDFPELTADHVRAALEFAALRERRLATST